MTRVAVFAALLSSITRINSAPAVIYDTVDLHERDAAITALSSATINSYTPYSYYAAAAECPANTTITWTCGSKLRLDIYLGPQKFIHYPVKCQQNPGFQPIAAGGNGDSVQYCGSCRYFSRFTSDPKPHP